MRKVLLNNEIEVEWNEIKEVVKWLQIVERW